MINIPVLSRPHQAAERLLPMQVAHRIDGRAWSRCNIRLPAEADEGAAAHICSYSWLDRCRYCILASVAATSSQTGTVRTCIRREPH